MKSVQKGAEQHMQPLFDISSTYGAILHQLLERVVDVREELSGFGRFLQDDSI